MSSCRVGWFLIVTAQLCGAYGKETWDFIRLNHQKFSQFWANGLQKLLRSLWGKHFKLKPQKLLEQFCVDSCRATKTFLWDLLVLRCSCAHQLLERSKLSRDVPARLLPWKLTPLTEAFADLFALLESSRNFPSTDQSFLQRFNIFCMRYETRNGTWQQTTFPLRARNFRSSNFSSSLRSEQTT